MVGVAPVRRWTTERKVDGSAWTKVVVGVVVESEAILGFEGSDEGGGGFIVYIYI